MTKFPSGAISAGWDPEYLREFLATLPKNDPDRRVLKEALKAKRQELKDALDAVRRAGNENN